MCIIVDIIKGENMFAIVTGAGKTKTEVLQALHKAMADLELSSAENCSAGEWEYELMEGVGFTPIQAFLGTCTIWSG